ncbi:GGDEF domain-containing protein [Rhodospirillum rubrum]|uniref:GGDEF domain-containing protein n=1 Tax=Rhodospirillum rubrum TaxID=1085 RepID=UPI001905FC38|nr:GGDEF domain-containing protein [Rhodospirillum rubrum]MBK1665762.1 GGDEF domain-containing protein [Rhodospirillum rubrum]MBK1677845.1 GGDEF domain-containing protein [Rhodospirillum rubrum]
MIDTTTMMLVLGLGNLLFGLTMAAYRQPAADHRVMRLWIAAQVLKGLGTLLVTLRGDVGLSLSIFGGNSLIFISYGLEVAAYRAYAKRPNADAFLPLLIIGYLVLFNGAAGITPPEAPRNHLIFLSSAMLASLAFLSSWFLLRAKRPPSPVKSLLITSNGLLGLAAVGRGMISLTADPLSPFANSPAHLVVYGLAYAFMITNGFGFLLLVKEDTDNALRRLADTDQMTGLANRRHFLTASQEAWKLAGRLGRPTALMMFDVDHFKQVNDSQGHAAGDAALVDLARNVREVLRDIDIFGRMGGEEFAITLPGCDLVAAAVIAERVRRAVAEGPGEGPAITISLGLTILVAGEPFDTALRRADHGLYQAKAAGRNRVCCLPAPQGLASVEVEEPISLAG